MNSNIKILGFLFLALQTLLAFAVADRCHAEQINVLVPAYANPCCDDGPAMWTQLISTANDPARNFGLHVILNPANGPGSERDVNYLDSSNAGPLASLKQAGAVVHGYVATGFGTRAIADVKFDIDQYLTNASLYQGYVDGIFFDEMSTDLANVGYYQELSAYVESKMANAQTFGNPGTHFVENPTNQMDYSNEDYAAVFDTLMTFENTGNEYLSNYTAPDYLAEKPASGFAHAIHTQAQWDDSLIGLASDRKAGFLYVTDDVFLNADDNPWDSLSSHWPQFTAELSAFNSVPEPTALLYFTYATVMIGLKRRRQ